MKIRVLFWVLFLGVCSLPLYAQSTSGAWPVKNYWQDKMPSGKTFIDGYFEFAEKRVKELYDKQTRLDCADVAITVFVEYASQNGLEVQFWFPAEKKTVSSKDAQFDGKGPEAFLKWARTQVGAQNLADNTFAVPIDSCKAGDVVLFDWNQSPEEPNFPGRDVWHTYFVGNDGAKIIYYGNLTGQDPLPITIAGESTQERIRNHPDRYGSGARRWTIFRKPPTPPTEREIEPLKKEGKIDTEKLNLRKGPSTSFDVLNQVKKGSPVKVTGRFGNWYRVEVEGKEGWVSEKFVNTGATSSASSAGAAGELNRMGGNNPRSNNPNPNH